MEPAQAEVEAKSDNSLLRIHLLKNCKIFNIVKKFTMTTFIWLMCDGGGEGGRDHKQIHTDTLLHYHILFQKSMTWRSVSRTSSDHTEATEAMSTRRNVT